MRYRYILYQYFINLINFAVYSKLMKVQIEFAAILLIDEYCKFYTPKAELF